MSLSLRPNIDDIWSVSATRGPRRGVYGQVWLSIVTGWGGNSRSDVANEVHTVASF